MQPTKISHESTYVLFSTVEVLCFDILVTLQLLTNTRSRNTWYLHVMEILQYELKTLTMFIIIELIN